MIKEYNLEKYEKLMNIVKQKTEGKRWDIDFCIKDENGEIKHKNIIMNEIVKYAMDISELTKDKIDSEFVVNKLCDIDVVRFGNFKKGIDDDIKYDVHVRNKFESVTTDEYKAIRPGAHLITTISSDSIKRAIALFNQDEIINTPKGIKKCNGIDLNNIDDIEQTLVHEFTHEMAMVIYEDNQQNQEVFKHNETTYANKFVNEKNQNTYYNGIKTDKGIMYSGISTIEVKEDGTMSTHNQIDEGFTEKIARIILKHRGKEILHPERYVNKVKIADKIFDEKGTDKIISQYILDPRGLIHEFENILVKKDDFLHYISSLANKKLRFSSIKYRKIQNILRKNNKYTKNELYPTTLEGSKNIYKKIKDYFNKINKSNIDRKKQSEDNKNYIENNEYNEDISRSNLLFNLKEQVNKQPEKNNNTKTQNKQIEKDDYIK